MIGVIKIATMLTLFAASIMLVIWVFRPGSTKDYTRFSKIALNDEFGLNERGWRKGGSK